MVSLLPLLFANVQTSDIAIVISAPHGGVERIEGVAERKGKDVPQFATVTDTRTDRLAQSIAAEVKKLTGKTPFLVVAKTARKYVDFNREDQYAYEDERAKATYDEYHASLAKAVQQALALHKYAILIDVHGQGRTANLIYRGTANGETTRGFEDHANAFQKTLEGQGLKLDPTSTETDRKENPSFNGGWIVRHYGASGEGKIMAIQLEFGGDYRTTREFPQTAKKVAVALGVYAKEFLTDKLVTKSANRHDAVGGVFAAR